MNLQEYTIKHGTAKLHVLAELVGCKPTYLNNLLYAVNNNPEKPKRPSMALAQKLVDASGGQLTLNGLANPVAMERSEKRQRMKKGFRQEVSALTDKARKRLEARRTRLAQSLV